MLNSKLGVLKNSTPDFPKIDLDGDVDVSGGMLCGGSCAETCSGSCGLSCGQTN